MKFTVCYTKLEDGGYMGQLLEWTNVLTSGKDLDECRDLLIEVAGEMADIYKEDGLKIPNSTLLVEAIDIPIDESLLEEDVPTEKTPDFEEDEEELLAHVG